MAEGSAPQVGERRATRRWAPLVWLAAHVLLLVPAPAAAGVVVHSFWMKGPFFVESGRIVLDGKPIPDVDPLDALSRITTGARRDPAFALRRVGR